MDKLLTAVVVAATIVTQKLLAAYNAFVDDYPTRLEKKGAMSASMYTIKEESVNAVFPTDSKLGDDSIPKLYSS